MHPPPGGHRHAPPLAALALLPACENPGDAQAFRDGLFRAMSDLSVAIANTPPPAVVGPFGPITPWTPWHPGWERGHHVGRGKGWGR
jgi:hypothetical protein